MNLPHHYNMDTLLFDNSVFPTASTSSPAFAISILTEGVASRFGLACSPRQPLPHLDLLRPSQDTLLHMLIEDLLFVAAPHLCAQGSKTFIRIGILRITVGLESRIRMLTHLCYNSIQR